MLKIRFTSMDCERITFVIKKTADDKAISGHFDSFLMWGLAHQSRLLRNI